MSRDTRRARILRGRRPTVTDDETGEPRPATDAELLQMGLRPMGRYQGAEHYDAAPLTDLRASSLRLTTVVKDRLKGARRTDRWERLPEPARKKLTRGGWQ